MKTDILLCDINKKFLRNSDTLDLSLIKTDYAKRDVENKVSEVRKASAMSNFVLRSCNTLAKTKRFIVQSCNVFYSMVLRNTL